MASIIDLMFEKRKRKRKRKAGFSYGDIGERIMRDDMSTYPDYLVVPRRKKGKKTSQIFP